MTDHGFTIERFDVIDSTNTYLLDKARQGAPGGMVAVADHQTAGRGRLDRRWEAPAGSALLMSVLLRESLPGDQLHLATAAVALSAVEAARATCGLAPGLKWPNDLVIEDAKVAGVLAEIEIDPVGGPPAIVVGIGINLTWPGPPGVGGTCLLDATGVAVERDEIMERLLIELSARARALQTSEGRSDLLNELAGSLVTIGRHVRVILADREIEGVASGLSPEGHLLVDGPDGPVEVSAGDVVHLRPA
jgi:BirA family biotin operon repressor/biotin-[acetyl-CoA-carboxylase] ligase